MKSQFKFIVCLLFWMLKLCISAEASDGLLPFPFVTYLSIVKEFHPVSKQATLTEKIAYNEILKAKGNFDPLLHSDYTQKTFGGKLYYGYFDNYLKVPTWIGDLSAGFEDNNGLYQNPTDVTPAGGLAYVGYTLPLGQGMLIDYRRAAVSQARLMNEIGRVERQKIVNKVLYEASVAYWDWYFAYQKYTAISNSKNNAEANFKMVKASIELGDISMIDSVESSLLLFERIADLQQAETDLINARLLASNYIWDETGRPREMSDSLRPFPDSTILNTAKALSPLFIQNALSGHPELNKVNLKLKSLTIDKRLARDFLLPNIDLTGKLLLKAGNSNINSGLWNEKYIANNNKIILTINQPLFLRKERAKYKEVRFKTEQVSWEQQLLTLETTNNIKSSQNKLNNYIRNRETQQKATLNYIKVRDGEITKFQAGEGNLLKINFYDTKAIEAILKNIKVNTEVYKAYCELYYKAGIMPEILL